ncbi:diiron oxygenase [Rhodococcus sp. 14C212]|uniref:AurF N-oxygenase family protein n=1 Tax=Rhodococcus sp. 14C212 TaxID=2711209 RepID=UPI0013EC18B7|nr:diiron oxygenase [Rhodococcus sp. 14C212]NGP08470.1 diiron oxygenase [Rhodococcus sp. 14C212]
MAEPDLSGARGPLLAPALPDHDPHDVVESAVVRGLARSWGRRATVKKREPDLDELFDPTRLDFPDELVPFHTHPVYRALDEERRARLRGWGWIAYNKNVMDIEQHVVNPGFALITTDFFEVGPSDTVTAGVLQAMVDEQYHTLMHLNASAVIRRRRGWRMPESALPPCRTVREHRAAVDAAPDPRVQALILLAFTTVAETSISAFLGLMTEDEDLQPVNRTTVALHRRDELSHASLAAELLKMVFTDLGPGDRAQLLEALAAGIEAFTGSDLGTWAAIVEAERVPGGREMLADTAAAPHPRRVVQDCSAIRRLCTDLGVADDLPVTW